MTPASPPAFPRLRQLGFFARLGVMCMIITLFGGYIVAAGYHLIEHHQHRDGRAGLSFDDIKGAYHGATIEAQLVRAMRENHPPELDPEDREVLSRWLAGDSTSIRVNYDNPDFDAFTPREIIQDNCLSCHAGRAPQGAGIALDFWDDVQQVAFSRTIQPLDRKILLASTHAHAPVMAAIALLLTLLGAMTRFGGWPVGILALIAGAALAVDVAAWWLARDEPRWVWAIITAGPAHMGAMSLLMLLIVLDLWLPRPRG